MVSPWLYGDGFTTRFRPHEFAKKLARQSPLAGAKKESLGAAERSIGQNPPPEYKPQSSDTFDIEDFVSNLGKKVGLQDLRVFPLGQVEAVYNLTEDSSLTTIYDYEFEAFQLRYNLQF